ncbi:MAG: hypothetical protein NC033_05340 [Clostridiales bacterium]|nr:hypothetical protein [Clostridiales bacterium]
MNMLAAGFANFINGIFANWQMLLFVIAAVLLLTAIAFRRFKTAVLIFLIVAGGIGAALIVDLIVEATSWSLPDLVTFAVKWVPTVLFTLTVLFSTLIGLKRGLRKSLILLLHEVVIAAVCIILYAVLVRLPAVDGFVLKLADMLFGGKGSLANTLGVSAECNGIKQVFVEWLPTVISGDFAIMLGGSKAYIYTLADLIYRVAFALILYILFLILDFIMYIIYLCFYSEGKYRDKIKKKYVDNKVDRRYSKHHTGGGVVGLVRGVAIGLLSLSFLGSALYIAVGRGDGKAGDFDFGDSNINEYYSVYRSIESYGTYGIFKVLNGISSTENVPYYLFAADLVFSGELDDEELGVSDNIVFREELAAYTGFARDTMDLLLKYGGDEIKPLIKGEATKSAFDTVMDVISKEAFRAEFNELISEFDAQTYIINFAMSFVNSAIANIDDMSFAPSLSADNRELLKILFTSGYLSDTIPDERALKEVFGGTDLQIVQPYINVSRLITKKDVQIIFNLVMDVLGKNTSTTDEVLDLVADLLPRIKQISLLNENRAEELDPVLGRLYCYAVNRYLTEEGTEGVAYADIYRENIEWVSEINAFLDVADSALKLYNSVSSAGKPLDAVIAVFDKQNPDYDENIANYDQITKCVLSSKILGKTLATSKIYTLIESALSSLFDGIYLPRDLVYETVYNADGEVEKAGEMYNVLNGLGAIGKNSDLLSMFESFDKDRDMEKFLNALNDTVNTPDENGNSLAQYIVRSGLLRSVISAAVINYGADYAYVPAAAREKVGGEPVKFIKEEELSALFDSLSELIEFIKPILQDEAADMKTAIAEFTEKPVFDTLLSSSTVFEGTVALHLVNALKGDGTVVIPQSLKDDLDGWATAGGKDGELKNLLGALDAAGIKVADIVSGEFDADGILDKFTSDQFTDENLQTCLKSSVLHYTVSKFLTGENNDFGTFKLTVPEAAMQKLEDDSIPALVRKNEVENVIKLVKSFGLSEDSDITSVLSKLVLEENKKLFSESYILSASVAGTLADSEDVGNMLSLPEKYKQAATAERLAKFNATNPWKAELVRLIDALDEIMGISAAEGEFVFDEEALTDKLSDFLKTMNDASQVNGNVTRLNVCYASEVVRASITARLDDILKDNIDEDILYGAKSGGYYTEKELKSLSGVLEIFDIDVMNIDGDELANKIKTEILSLNAAAPEGYTGTKLDAVYPSAIFSGVLSKALDDVLLNSKDEEENTVQLIDENVLYSIKGGYKRYGKELISELIYAVNGLGIENFDDLNNLDINEAVSDIEDTDVVISSVIIRGVFTKQISENNTLGVDHPKAYEEDLKIIKKGEIKAVLDLVENINNVEDTYFDDVSLSKIQGSLFNADRSVKSYLILKAVSDSIVRDNQNLIVDRDLIDSYGCIDGDEVWALCEAFTAMFGEDAKVNSVGATGFEYPAADKRGVIVKSRIVRAKITEQIISQNAGNLYVSDENLDVITDTKGEKRGVISAHEMNAVFNAIDASGAGQTFTVPTINLETLRGCAEGDIDLLFASDLLRYKVCDTLLIDSLSGEAESAYEIGGLTRVTKYVISEQQAVDLIKRLRSD